MSRARVLGVLFGTCVTAALALSLPLAAVAAAATRTTHPKTVSRTLPRPFTLYNAFNSGMANSSIKVFNKSGELVLYGDNDVLYALPPSSLIGLGETLYQQNCEACHSAKA